MVNLLDLQLLHSKDSDDDDDDSSSDDDDDDLKVKDILDCLDQSIEGKLNKDLFNDSDNSKENDSMGPEELKGLCRLPSGFGCLEDIFEIVIVFLAVTLFSDLLSYTCSCILVDISSLVELHIGLKMWCQKLHCSLWYVWCYWINLAACLSASFQYRCFIVNVHWLVHWINQAQ